MQKFFKFIFFLLPIFLSSCCAPPCEMKYCIEGAQEFVLDSYRIREGKFSILELEGQFYSGLPTQYLQEYEDRIDEDDVLLVAVVHPSRQDLTQAINSVGQSVGYRIVNGKLRLPGLPDVAVKGLTLEQARQRLQEMYDGEISHTQVFLEYRERLHSKVLLLGAVHVPEVPVNGRIRLYEVLSRAGVPPTANLFKSYVEREGRMLAVDLHKLVREGDMTQNIVMRPKDKIFIADPMAATITVMGEVGLAKVIPIPNGFISIREALAAAGGIPYTGDKRCILVIRGNIVSPKIYRLSWSHITYLPNDSLLLMPGDTIYISEAPITKWNRFIEQLLPSSLLIDLGIKTKGVFN